MREKIRKIILVQGAANLREFGYPTANSENILTDEVFRKFFKSMLEENRGRGNDLQNSVIEELLAEVSKEPPVQSIA